MADEEIPDGFLGCGIVITFGADAEIFGKLIDVSSIGASRVSVPAPHQNMTKDTASGMRWVPKLYSCIATSKPFRITGVFEGNYDWSAVFKELKAVTLTWPPEKGYTTGGTLGWLRAGVIDFDVSVSLESRAIRTMIIDPSGMPVITEGTEDT